MPAAPNVRLEGIEVQYGTCMAVDGVDLELPSGARIAIVGENGAGKSTLLHVLSGRLKPSAGQCFVDGAATALHRHGAAAAHGIGLIPQHDDLIPAWSVLDNLLLGAEGARGFAPLPRSAQRRRLLALAAETGLDLDVDAPAETLSLAARQRATILRALFRGVRVLLLDEPTAVLSPSESADLWRATRRLSDRGATIVFVTHRLDEVLAEADRIVVLRGGKRTR